MEYVERKFSGNQSSRVDRLPLKIKNYQDVSILSIFAQMLKGWRDNGGCDA